MFFSREHAEEKAAQNTFTCQTQQKKKSKIVWNMFKVKNKDNRTTSMTYFTPFSSICRVDCEQVVACWELNRLEDQTEISRR